MLGLPAASARFRGIIRAVGVYPAGPRGKGVEIVVPGVEDGVAAGIRVCTLRQAIGCAQAGFAGVKAGVRGRVVAYLSHRGRRRSCRAGPRRGRGLGALGLVVDREIVAALCAGTLVELLVGVQPASSGAGVWVSSSEDHKVAGLVRIAVFPAVSLS